MKKSFARAVSYIFNPLSVMIFAPFFLVYKTTHNIQSAWFWTGYTLIFLLTVALFLFMGVKKKIFTDLDVSRREQRPFLFLVTGILTCIYSIGLFALQAPQILLITVCGIVLGIILISIINIRIKASIHVATVAALIFAVAIVYGGYYLLLLLFIPFIGWARVKTKRHTIPETVIGGILGCLLSLSIYLMVHLFVKQ